MKYFVFAGLLTMLISGCSFFTVEPYHEIRKFDPQCPDENQPLILPEIAPIRNLTPAGTKMLFNRSVVQAENPTEQWVQPPEAMLYRYLLTRRDPARQLPGNLRLTIVSFKLDNGHQTAELAVDAAFDRQHRQFRVSAPLPACNGTAAATAIGTCFEELARELAAWCRPAAPAK